MSDQSSESSGEWVVLNETDEDLSPENQEQSLNLELNYNAVCNAASDSIRSSFSSEELEWQYEQFDDYIPLHSSYIEELELEEFDRECTETSKVNKVEDYGTSNCGFLDGEEENIPDFVTVSKIHCYKHHRNDYLNFILNLMLALVISSAVGLGIGHFLGWSHKCYTKINESNKAATVKNLPVVLELKQNFEDVAEPKKEVSSLPLLSENLSKSLLCLDSKDGSPSTNQEIYNIRSNVDIVSNANMPDIFVGSDVLELKNQEGNHTVPDLQISDIVTHFNWDKMSNNEVSFENDLSDSREVLPGKRTDHSSYEVKDIEVDLLNKFYIKDKVSLKEIKEVFDPAKMSYDNAAKLHHEDEINHAEFETLKKPIRDTNSHKETNMTSKLRVDLIQIIESLTSVALTRVADFADKNSLPMEDSKVIIKLYSDFQNLINTKLNDIDNFVLSTEYKARSKASVKCLKKMVYCLVDSVDHLLKVSFKVMSKENRKINIHKFSNNISRVIFNFNRKWDNISRFWVENVEKSKFQEFKERSFRKENKQWRQKRAQFEKDSRNNRFKRYSMKPSHAF